MTIPLIVSLSTPESTYITQLRDLVEDTLDKEELIVKIQELYCEYYNDTFAYQVDNLITRDRIEGFKRDFKIKVAELMSNRYYQWKQFNWSKEFMAELSF